MAAYDDIAKHYYGADLDKRDPKVDAQAAAVAKKNGFASLAQYEDVSMNITMVMLGIDPQTKKFTEPPEQIKDAIAALSSDKSLQEAEKKEGVAQLEAALTMVKPIQFKENIALVLKYFDKLIPFMQEMDTTPCDLQIRNSTGIINARPCSEPRPRARHCRSRPVGWLSALPQGVVCMLSRLASNVAISSPRTSPQMTPDSTRILAVFMDCSEAPMRSVDGPDRAF